MTWDWVQLYAVAYVLGHIWCLAHSIGAQNGPAFAGVLLSLTFGTPLVFRALGWV